MHTIAASPRFSRNLIDALSAAREPLLFGVRLWASVCLALFVAFWLELDNPFWAGTSAAIDALKAQRMSAEATLAQAEAQLRKAQVNLERTRILSPADGYVTNLLAQLGDYVNVGVNTISVVDANSFWVDAYFEETNLAPIRVGDPAQIKLMGYTQIVRGHVDSIARAINVSNAQPNSQGVATVNPIFTWVRLAQRIPVRIHINEVPPGIVLPAGMTATVDIEDRASAPAK